MVLYADFCFNIVYIMELNKLKDIRKGRKITLKELSLMTKIGRGTLSRIESGIANPTHNNLEAIAKALGVRIEILL